MNTLMRLVKEEQGQGMAEYGLILALVAVAVIGALTLLGPAISEHFDTIRDELESAGSGGAGGGGAGG